MPSHIVFGAGLIGGFIGGVLTSLHLNVTLVCRPSVRQKLNKGLKLTDYLGNQKQVEALKFLNLENLESYVHEQSFCNFLWLTVKCTGVTQASKDIHPLVGPNTIILCCQNGLGSDQIIKQRYPKNTVLRVMVPFNVAEPEHGHLHRGSEGILCIETVTNHITSTHSLVQQINTDIMPVTHTTNMQELLWAKLQLNLGNSINALADIPVKMMLEQQEYRIVIAILMKELLSVTKALKIKLPKLTALPARFIPTILSLPDFLFNLVASKMLAIDPTVRTSMWWDISQGKKTEIDYLNGAIITTAKNLNIKCPGNENIISIIKEIEKGTEQIPKKGISGKTLLQEVRSK